MGVVALSRLRLLALLSFVTAIFLLFSPGSSTAQPPLILSTESEAKLAGHLDLLIDPGGKLTLSDVIVPQNASRFTAIPGYLNRGYTRDTAWLRTRVARSDSFPEQVWLRLGPAYIDIINVYIQNGSDASQPSSYREIRLGDHVPVAQRPVVLPEFILPVTLPSNAETTILIQVHTSSTLVFEGALYTTAALLTYNTNYLIHQGAYLGIALVIAVVNLIYFLRIGDRLFLYFGLYILALFGQQLGMNGMISTLWPAHAHQISDYLVGSLIGTTLIFFCLFAMQLFTVVRSQIAKGYLRFMVVIGFTTILSVPFEFYAMAAPFALIGTIGTMLLMIWLSTVAVRRGEPAGKLYLAAFGISSIGYTIQIFRVLGLIPIAWWNVYGVQISSLINMVMMTLALTERLRLAEEKATTAARNAELKAVEIAKEMTVELRDERQKLSDALERQVRFTDVVNHEYRTPLAIIRTNLDILRDGETEESTRKTGINVMQRAVARLVEVVETSFSISRLTESEHLERIEVADFLSEVRDEALLLWQGATLKLPVIHNKLMFVLADRAQLKTALFNLIDNAVKYGGMLEPIIFSQENDGRQVCITVADLGIGIAEDELENVRRRFKRGSSSAGTTATGTGFGLYLVDRIISEHGGRFELHPNIPRGVVAKIILPAAT